MKKIKDTATNLMNIFKNMTRKGYIITGIIVFFVVLLGCVGVVTKLAKMKDRNQIQTETEQEKYEGLELIETIIDDQSEGTEKQEEEQVTEENQENTESQPEEQTFEPETTTEVVQTPENTPSNNQAADTTPSKNNNTTSNKPSGTTNNTSSSNTSGTTNNTTNNTPSNSTNNSTTESKPEAPAPSADPAPTEKPVVGRGTEMTSIANNVLASIKAGSTNNTNTSSASCVMSAPHYNFLKSTCDSWVNGSIDENGLRSKLNGTFYPFPLAPMMEEDDTVGVCIDNMTIMKLEVTGKSEGDIEKAAFENNPSARHFVYLRVFYNSSTNKSTVYVVNGKTKIGGITPGLEGIR